MGEGREGREMSDEEKRALWKVNSTAWSRNRCRCSCKIAWSAKNEGLDGIGWVAWMSRRIPEDKRGGWYRGHFLL